MVKAGIINVAASSSHTKLGGGGPIFGDGTFRYIPIFEKYPTENSWYYGDLVGLLEFLPQKHWIDEEGDMLDHPVHYDPEFKTFTFGDYPYKPSKVNLGKLEKGDYLFFLARLIYRDNDSKRERWVADEGFYIIGYFKIKEVVKDVSPPYSRDFLKKYGNNAHVRRGEYDGGFWIFKGGKKHSALLKKAVPFDKSTAIKVLKTTAKGAPLTWDGYTELERINHYTRTARLLSEPEQINALWEAIDEMNQGQSSYADYLFG